MDSKVFVTEDTRHNLSRAVEFGEIIILETEDFPQFRDGRPVLERITRALLDFQPKDDYLLLVGDPVIIGLCCAVLASMGHKLIKVLKWDNQSRCYLPINLPLR